jgi:hypothetical protein
MVRVQVVLRRLLAHTSRDDLDWQCTFGMESGRLCVQSRIWTGVVPGPFFYL